MGRLNGNIWGVLAAAFVGAILAGVGLAFLGTCPQVPADHHGLAEPREAGPQPGMMVDQLQEAGSYIVQGRDMETVALQVRGVGGTVTHELAIINAVGARLTPDQRQTLQGLDGISRIYNNRRVELSGRGHGGGGDGENGNYFNDYFSNTTSGEGKETHYPQMINAHLLHAEGFSAQGVTVAVLDTGLWLHPALVLGNRGRFRVLGGYDAREDNEGGSSRLQDDCGHGTHVSSVILNSTSTESGGYQGLGPAVYVVPVKAFGADGTGTYLDVIRGIGWVVARKDLYNIRVLNLSFSATPLSYYWDDPLNQAVMQAWRAGIVVVAAAGNSGPGGMTIGVPGNVPYVITVGAVSDNYTAGNAEDEFLCAFSSAGPTVEGFVKPEVVAPGGHILGLMPPDSWIAESYPQFRYEDDEYFIMSGTSQAAAVVSGAAALLLEEMPWLTPDEVKGRLMATARPAVDETGELAYSVFQQGAGLIDAYAAVHQSVSYVANQGLDVEADLSGVTHFGGRANQNPDGSYYITGIDGYMWSDGYARGNGYMWSDSFARGSGYMWSDGQVHGNGYMWSDSFAFSSGYMWSDGLVERMSINFWVPQE